MSTASMSTASSLNISGAASPPQPSPNFLAPASQIGEPMKVQMQGYMPAQQQDEHGMLQRLQSLEKQLQGAIMQLTLEVAERRQDACCQTLYELEARKLRQEQQMRMKECQTRQSPHTLQQILPQSNRGTGQEHEGYPLLLSQLLQRQHPVSADACHADIADKESCNGAVTSARYKTCDAGAQAGDSRRTLVVQKINQLGFNAPQVLKTYFSQFGKVDRIHLPSKLKQRSMQGVPRPSSIGFIVMSNETEARAALESGPVFTINGKAINVRAYNQAKQDAETGGDVTTQTQKSTASLSAQEKEEKENLQNAACHLTVVLLKINRLGRDAAHIIEEHYSKFGKVQRVCIPSKTKRAKNPSSTYSYRRVSGLGFLVMSSEEEVQAIIGAGPEHMVDGKAINIRAFRRNEHKNLGECETLDEEIPGTNDDELLTWHTESL
jgi:hypothetical protein